MFLTKRIFWILAVLCIIALILFGCSELNKGPTDTIYEVHPESWMNEASTDFHGEKVAVSGAASCAVCHGADYTGGQAGVSCYTCHGGPSGHPSDWVNPSNADYHGSYVIVNGWQGCAQCHGDDFRGGTSGTSCYQCHNGPSGHPDGFLDTQSRSFHGVAIAALGWNMTSCQTCHGTDYAGGDAGLSCLDCHTGTPEACNTCHGSGDQGAPPPDLDGNTGTNFKGVGAHAIHLAGDALTNGFSCSECHVVPQSLYDTGHVDSELPAEISFGTLATDSSRVTPTWDGNDNCSNVYCHGAFDLGAQPYSVSWTIGDTECGACHGLPPAAPHVQINACQFCHGSVVNADQEIIDKTKHINGKTDMN